MPREFSHYAGCRNRDPDNCGGCALTTGGAEGPNYSAWTLAYMENGRSIPAKWIGAFKRELASDNRAYAENVKATAARLKARFSDGTTFNGETWVAPHVHTPASPTLHTYEVCNCGATRKAAALGKPASEWHACALCSSP